MDLLEFTRRKAQEATSGAAGATTKPVQPPKPVTAQKRYTQEEMDAFGLDYAQRMAYETAGKNVDVQSLKQLVTDINALQIPGTSHTQTTTGGYYSRPVVDTTGVEDIQNRLNTLSTAAKNLSYPVKQAEQVATKAATTLESAGAALKSSYEKYKTTPTWQAAQAYNQALAVYQTAKTEYEKAYTDYQTAHAQYKQLAGEAENAFNAWQKYVDGSRASYDAWKGTIRDAETVKKEMDYVDSRIENAQFDTEMWEWEQKKALLQEEYDWAVYGAIADIKNTPYFGMLSENDRLMVIDMTEMKNWSDEDKAKFENWLIARRNAPEDVLAWADRIGWNRLEEIESSLRRYQNQQSAQETVRKAQEAAKGGWGGFISSLATIPAGLWDALTSPFAVAQELLWYDDRYGNLDPNGPGYKTGQWVSAVRDTVGKNIAGDVYDEQGNQIEDGGLWRQGLSTLYKAGMSATDNLARLAVGVATGGGSTVTLGLAAMSSFGSTVRQISEQGGDPVQALAMGVISGGLEVLTEKFSVDRILKLAKGDPLNLKKTLKEMLIQGAVEISEEEVNFLASTIAEAAIMGENAAYALEVKELMAQGMSEEEAKEQANWSLIWEAAETAAQSFLSGGMMTGTVSTVNNFRYSKLGQKLGLGKVTLEQAQKIIDSGLESAEDTEAHQMAQRLQEKIDAGKVPTKGELAQQMIANEQAIQAEGQQSRPEQQQTGAYISMEEYANSKSPVWRNVDYADNETKNAITQQMHTDMVDAGAVVTVSEDVVKQVNEALPDLRGMKKKDRTPILKAAVNALKNNLRQFLSSFSGQKFDFSVNGKVLEAKLYSTGINEVLEKVTRQKANMLYSTENIFRNAWYLYSTPDYDGDPNVYRWNYFYTPVQIGNETVGVRIAVRDMATPRESQIYNWGIKKDASLDGEGRGADDRISPDVSSDASDNIIDQGGGIVNTYNQNGGNENASTYGQADTGSTGAGAGVLYGSGQRNAGASAGEQAGSLDGGAETAAQRTERIIGASRIEAAAARQDLAGSLKLQKVSAQEIGLAKGTERRNLQVLPQEHWDAELQSLAEKAQSETGKEPMFVIGEIYVQGADKQSHRVRAAITDGQVILQADYTKVPLEKILDHEIYHYKAAFARKSGHNLNNMNMFGILDQFSEAEYMAVLDAYLEALDGQYGLSEARSLSTDDAYNEIVALIREEMMADAYAGINAFGAGADKFSKAVNARMDTLGLGKNAAQENGVRQTNGPNENGAQIGGERFSLEDSVEETADLVAFHNITLQQLQDAIARRGLVMPSLAITNKGLSAFGEISLLFNKDTIDPRTDQQNRLYGADAWTPQQNALKKNAKFDEKKTAEIVHSIRNSIGAIYADQLFNVTPEQFKNALTRADGNIFDVYAHNLGMQTAYALEKGIIATIPGRNGVLDRMTLQNQLNSELDTDEGWRQYRRWLREISDSVILSYDSASNADILSNMQKQPATAKTFKLSENGELVVPAVEYSSVDEVRRNKHRLSENAEAETRAVANELLNFAKNINGETKVVVNAINSAFANRYNTAGIVDTFQAQGIDISQRTAEELQALYKKAVELPTQYFEAKPGREVALEEIKAAVMPQTSENAQLADMKTQLESMGVAVIEYQEGDKESRKSAVNSFEMLRFSTDDSDYQQESESREARIAEILASVSTNHAAQFERYTRLTKENPKLAAKEGEELSRGLFRHEFMEYRDLTEQRDRAKENTAKIGGERYSTYDDVDSGRITPKMSDSERTTILQKKNIVAEVYSGQAEEAIKRNQTDLESDKFRLVKSALVRIGEQFDVFTDYNIADVEVKIQLSKSNIRESVSKDIAPTQIAKLLPVLKTAVENAIGIESHVNRYFYDDSTVFFDNLIGGYVDGEYFVPVRFGLKHSTTGDVTLYVIVDQQPVEREKIKAEVVKIPGTQNVSPAISRSAYKISIANLARFVNGKDLVRYLPDDMLSAEQKKMKWEAIAETVKRTNDKNDAKYTEFLASGNLRAVQNMVNQAAKVAGYTIKAYHGTNNRQEKDTWNPQSRSWDTEYSRITVFKKQYDEQVGHFFNSDMDNASGYGSDLYSVYLMLKNPLVIDCHGQNYASITFDGKEMDTYEWAAYAKKNRYDGVIFENISDGVGYGDLQRLTTDYVVFDSNRIKSADPVTYDNKGNVIPLSERFSVTNRDIRYSTDDDGVEVIKSDERYELDEAEYRRVRSEMEAKDKQWRDNFLYNELGAEGVERYKATQKMVEDREKAERAKRAKENRIQAGEVKLDAESRATEAKRLLENKLLKTFSIPDGMRGELRAYIGGFADRIVKHGALTEDDRRRFFARMYEAGAVTIPADDYYGEARSYIKGGHIYVPSSVVEELGDDWQDVRRRAFAAGIYLNYERTDKNGNSVAGIDVWNSDLAADLPGLFNAEDTDETMILRKIIHVAEQGREEKISLAEYVARVAREEYTSENDVLDSLERQMLWALESFAETAQVEIQLKDRNLRRVMKERAENQERAQRAKERRELQELQQKTLKSLQWLNKNRRLAPEELREEWDRALSDIDLYAVGAANEMNWSNKYQATWKDLADMYKEARAKDPNFHEDAEIERIISRLDDQKISDMDPAALMDLYKLATGLRTAFYNRNNVLNDEQYRIFEEVYMDAKEELTEAGKGKEGAVDRFFNREQLSAMNVLERMAGWNPNSAWYSMAKQLERGERDVRAFTVKANRILEDYLKEHKDFVMRADGQGKDAIWYTIEVPELTEWGKGNKPIFGDTVTVYMTPAQKVHMYLESKNLDNLRHMEGGRTFVVDKELYGKGKRQEALAQGRTIRLAPETVKQLVSNLTDEEMELAQVLDQYYNGFATGEINRVSNVLYGYDKAMGKHYAPIYTNQNYTNAEFGTFDITAEGVGNLKGRVQYSKNPSYNISAFDAFERNVNQTARFVGMAIPIRNWTTLMNWTEYKNSMKDTITHSWGLEHKRYIEKLLTDLQGGKLDREDVISETGEKLLSNYISSVFGANLSIVLKQLGSIPLAGAYLGVGNVVPGAAQVERLDHALIGKYTQDLAWRGMGYSMPETKQLKDHPNWTQNNKAVRFAIGGGAITAMDQWAASVLWPWAENKVRKENPDLEVGTPEQIAKGESLFYKKVAEEFENAVARSQSTSDQMHQGTLRKSKHTLTRMFTMFTSDSAQTYNTLRQMIGEAAYYKKAGQLENAKRLSRAAGAGVVALLLNSLWGEGVTLLAALIKNKGKKYRDEEGEMTAQSLLKQMVMGLISNLSGTVVGGDTLVDMIGAKIYGEKFYAPESMEVSLIQDMYNTVDTAMDIIFGTVRDMAEVAIEDGDIGEYFKQNGNDILGRVKDAALEIASYWGIPGANMEAYIMGALKFIPGFGAVYDGWFESADKNALGGLTGENLAIRVGSLLDQRGIEASNGTAEALAELYEAGFAGAVPGGVPSSVSVDGEEHALNIGQQQHYGHVWADVVMESLDKVVSSERFAEATPEVREGMLKKLYSYASEQAKASMFDDYKPGSTKEDIAAYEAAGLDIADYFAVKAEGHNADKYLEAVTQGLPEDNADDLMDKIAELEEAAGEDRVADVQKWRTCVNAFGKPMYQLAALASYMTDAQFKKAKAADDFGVDLSDFVKLYEIREKYDENGNKSFSNAEYKKAIDSLRLNTQDSAVLWQLFTGAKSAKNNPYNTAMGQKVIDAWAD